MIFTWLLLLLDGGFNGKRQASDFSITLNSSTLSAVVKHTERIETRQIPLPCSSLAILVLPDVEKSEKQDALELTARWITPASPQLCGTASGFPVAPLSSPTCRLNCLPSYVMTFKWLTTHSNTLSTVCIMSVTYLLTPVPPTVPTTLLNLVLIISIHIFYYYLHLFIKHMLPHMWRNT